MRTLALNSVVLPLAALALTVTWLRSWSDSSIPRMSYVSSPVSLSDCHVCPLPNSKGNTPMTTGLLRWMRS
jgi:hypothetical protein